MDSVLDNGHPLQGIELDNMLPAFGPQTIVEDLPTFASGDYNDDDMNNDGNMDGNDNIKLSSNREWTMLKECSLHQEGIQDGIRRCRSIRKR
jgi:hypothetical protein